MKRLTILMSCVLASGCATHPLQFSSEPQGATVSLRQAGRWVPKGTTPCEVEMNWRYADDRALVSFPSGPQQEIDLCPTYARGRRILGHGLLITGFIAIDIASFGSGSLPWALGGAGTIGTGFWTLDGSYEYMNSTFHVDLKETGQRTTDSTLSTEGAPSVEK